MSAVLLVVALLAAAADAPEPEPEQVTVAREDGAVHVDARLGGRLVGYAVPREAEGLRAIWLLVAPHAATADDPKADRKGEATPLPPCPVPETTPDGVETIFELYRFDPLEGRLERLRADLPADATAVDAADLDADGRDELLLFRRSGAWLVPVDAAQPLTPLVEAEGMLPARLDRPFALEGSTSERPVLGAANLDGLSLYGLATEGRRFEQQARVELPLAADVEESGIEVWADVTLGIGRDEQGTLFLGTDPETSGTTRVRTTLVALAAAGQVNVTECWGRLPGHEELLASTFLFVDDRPVLFVTTKPSGRLDLFGEQQMRIFPLERDRSHLGLSPLLATGSRANIWQAASPLMHDADGDGREDLVIGYWKGILGDTIVLDVYPRREDGAFETRPRSTEIDVKQGDRSLLSYGEDVTGDGRADLIVRGKPGLLVYPGRASSGGGNLVEARPHVVRLPAEDPVEDEGALFTYGRGRLFLVDLDGDGVREILLVDRGSDERPGRFRVIRLAPPAR